MNRVLSQTCQGDEVLLDNHIIAEVGVPAKQQHDLAAVTAFLHLQGTVGQEAEISLQALALSSL